MKITLTNTKKECAVVSTPFLIYSIRILQDYLAAFLQDFLGVYAAQKLRINSASTMFALNSGNIKFIPFQFRPLARMLNAEHPRILIADEVGVGKTIETGIILKEFEKRDSVKSAIIFF